jgi:predicted HTH transcriptional regulator
MLEGALDSITPSDLQRLVTDQRPESRTLDYKRDLALTKDEDKRELSRDIASFANAGGGDLIYGIEDDKDSSGKNLGYPKAVVGVACQNFDLTKQRIESIVRDTIQPRVQGLAIHQVEGFERGPVIIIRVPSSWTGPHMVTTATPAFWSRNNSGRAPLDVHEIRAAFVVGSDLATKVRQFRDGRLGRVLGGETPIPI